jgi:hydroxymethylglutaryl-CoA lyase
MKSQAVHYVECPRDAMQGWAIPIATETKIAYLNLLLQVGFDTLDCLSFVSPKAIPQMADSHQVVRRLNMQQSTTRILAIVANERGASEACAYEAITQVGFPFSISQTFQLRNTNSTIEESWDRVKRIQQICLQHNKELVIYFSMGFGNPYGDPFDVDIIHAWVEKMTREGIRIFSLADTVGLATAAEVELICSQVVRQWPGLEIGAHLHSHPQDWKPKLNAALNAGCSRIDGALKGIGGCPMAGDVLVGNMNTELLLPYLEQLPKIAPVNRQALHAAAAMAATIFH